MYNTLSSLSIIVAVIVGSCNDTTPGNTSSVGAMDSSSSARKDTGVEKNAANTQYKPAFEGQTRIAAVKTQTPFEGKLLSKELKRPWGIASLPDGRLLITEKEGTMRIATTAGKVSAPITGLPEVDSRGQGGLLGLTVDPAFSTNRMVYWSYSGIEGDVNLTAVAKGKLAADEKTLENVQVIYKATPAFKSVLHYGSRILFDKTGNLVVSTGERSERESRPQAQFLNSAMGKIVRITTEGKPAAGNPFLNVDSAKPEIYSYGHRNVQGLAFHPTTGDLWDAEFGPRGGDELNRVEAGKNYGWPTITYGLEYSGDKVGGAIQQKAGMEQPVYYWDPVISPSGMTFYTGDSIPEWKNNLFITGLSSMQITRLVIKGNKVTGEERLLTAERKRFRAVIQGTDAAMYAVTDDGCLYRIGKK
ncbi:MAG: PQQ-dependent sugar dehydrogenase [Ferruginibacter sp.]